MYYLKQWSFGKQRQHADGRQHIIMEQNVNKPKKKTVQQINNNNCG